MLTRYLLLPFVITTAAIAQQPAPATPATPATPAAPAAGGQKLPEAMLKAREAASKGDFAGAHKLLLAEAEKGNMDAANIVGEMLSAGRGVKASPEEALKWFTKAADAGNGAAQANLATLYFAGAGGVKQDLEKAKFLLQQAAEGGFAPAQFQMGAIAEAAVDPKVREPNWKEPRGWYEKAAAQGHAEALLAMSRFFDNGMGGPAEPEKGTEAAIAAARGGSVVAMNEIAVRYQKGIGIKQDNVAAIGWLSLAAQNGLPNAHVNLANCYENGNGCAVDLNRAGQHYAAAAKAGNPVAMHFLARMFEEGRGTEKNPAFAFVNYSRAADAGIEDAKKKRDELGPKLTPAQKKEAESILKGGTPPAGASGNAPKKK